MTLPYNLIFNDNQVRGITAMRCLRLQGLLQGQVVSQRRRTARGPPADQGTLLELGVVLGVAVVLGVVAFDKQQK